MGNVFRQDLGAVLDALADAIEGGNAYAGGTVHKGIPGLYSNDRGLRSGDDTPVTVVGASTSTTTFDVDASRSWDSRRWVPSDKGAPFFAVCTASNGATDILHERRKITGWNNTTKVFTVSPAFSAAPVADDTFEIQQGFKRLPNGVDIETDHADGYDRHFHLSADVGEPSGWYGDTFIGFRTLVTLRLRLLKAARLHDWTASAWTNLAIIRATLPTRGHLDGTYARALVPVGGETAVVVDDEQKIVVEDRYVLHYRIDGTAK